MSENDWQWLATIVLIVGLAAVAVTHCICDSRARIASARCGCDDEEEQK